MRTTTSTSNEARAEHEGREDGRSSAQRTPSGARPQLSAIVWLLPVTLLLVHAWYYMPFMADDAFISLRYSERLLDGDGLTWASGPPVEGYSNLLWVLGCALLGLVMPLVTAARVLGLIGALLMFAALRRLQSENVQDSSVQHMPALLAGSALAATGPVAVWAIGGLEANLLGGLLAMAIADICSRDRVRWAGLWLALACLTRPDGPLFVVVLAAVEFWGTRSRSRDRRARLKSWWRRDWQWQRTAWIVLPPLTAYLGQMGFRVMYYDDWVPNTAHIKAQWTVDRLEPGLDYVWASLEPAMPLLGMAFLGLLLAMRGPRRGVVLRASAAGGAWIVYIISVGGDIFPAGRHVVPALVCLTLVAFCGLERLWSISSGSERRLSIFVLVALLIASLYRQQQRAPENHRAITERWEWDGQVIGETWARAFGDKNPLLSVDPAGALPFYSRFDAVDNYGLSDRHIARTKAKGGAIGHDHGDGAYVLGRQPDLMVFGLPTGGTPSSHTGREIAADPQFARDYRQLFFCGYDPHFVRNRSYLRLQGKLGFERGRTQIVVPGYLFQSPGSCAVPGIGEGMGTLVQRTPQTAPPVTVEPGHWRISLVPDSPEVGISVTVTQGSLSQANEENQSFVAAGDTELRFELFASGIDSWVGELRLDRGIDGPTQAAGENIATGRKWRVRGVAPLDVSGMVASSDHPLNRWGKQAWRSVEGPRPRTPGKREACGGALDGFNTGLRVNTYLNDQLDGAAIVMRTETFELPEASVLALCLSGGNNSVAVRLKHAETDRSVRVWHGRNTNSEHLELAALDGLGTGEFYLEIDDRSREGWGHIHLSGVALLAPRRPAGPR